MSDHDDQYFDQLVRWLEMEGEAEREKIAERRQRYRDSDAEKFGETLVDLIIQDSDAGLGGRFLLTFRKRNRNLMLPWNRFRVGSPVVVSTSADDFRGHVPGVISRRTTEAIQIALNDWPEGEIFRVDLASDEITRLRQQHAIAQVRLARGRLAQLRETLLGDRPPQYFDNKAFQPAGHLNDSQNEAIQFALSAQDLAIVHGPPGTGKTTTVVEFIRQAVARRGKVLATAPSNTAVDHLLDRLILAGVRAIRLGHPARVQQALQEYTLDGLVEQDRTMKVVKDLMRDAEKLMQSAGRYTRAKPAKGEKQELRREARRLRDEARELEKLIVENVLDRAEVVCATTTFDQDIIGERRFDWVVIDEACQTTEAGCWPVIHRGDRLVLAGDHCQLPPTVLSVAAAREGFAVSMMERLVHRYGDLATRLLTVQYRMHESIMRFSSQQFYKDQLTAFPSVADHRLSDISQIAVGSDWDAPLEFIDTAGASWDEEVEPDGESRLNRHEAELILKKVTALQGFGVMSADIAVIAPYAAQVRWLRERCRDPEIEIDTVDGFQGREKEVILISLVRSNSIGEIGFLGDTRRMNVAMTRARRKLIMVGDSATLAYHPFYEAFIEYVDAIGAHRTVWSEDNILEG